MKDYSILKRLEEAKGQQYWRTLDELAGTEEFHDLIQREFPNQAPSLLDPVSRRNFLKMMGASMAFGGLTACTGRQEEVIVPYAKEAPENYVPGKPLYYATAMTIAGYGMPLLAESHMGRPTKLEGNPEHPASQGATDAYSQASILNLYDPDRSQNVRRRGQMDTWGNFVEDFRSALDLQTGKNGAGFRILTGTVTSPTLAAQLTEVLQVYPESKWVQYEPAGPEGANEGTRLALGDYAGVQYQFANANVILALDSDFLGCGAGNLRYARDFAARRRVYDDPDRMSRLYVVEPMPTSTGSVADHRLPLRASQIETFARALAAELGVAGVQPAGEVPNPEFISALAKDLQQNRGAGIVIAGDYQTPAVHALAHAINAALGNVGKTVVYTEPVEAFPSNQTASLRELVEEMIAGSVELLLILGENPVFTAPADLEFAKALDRVALRAHLSLFYDETSRRCHWHVPEAHYLEAWSDVRAHDGSVCLVQPLIEPLYGGKSAHELLAVLSNQPSQSGYELIRSNWMMQRGQAGFEKFWQKALHDGFIEGTAFAPADATPNVDAAALPASQPDAGELEIVFRPDPGVFDGRFANNGWLQELPRPFTKLTWDNAALMSPKTAARLGLVDGDLVEFDYKGRSIKSPILRVPGHAQESVTVFYGQGRANAGRVGDGTGFNMYKLRTSDAPYYGIGLKVRKVGDKYPLAITQGHFNMENRHLVRAGTVEEYRKDPHFVEHIVHAAPDANLYKSFEYKGYKWGMAIDTSVCVQCNACVVACQAENNIPVVGKEQVLKGREMHWLRVDAYYEGPAEDPKIYNQPVPCMHCENAPCEPVCPVNATTHSNEGINEMTYNRCVGTRFCSNNCPYKVRRFNFLNYTDWETPTFKALRNPDVTVRQRGVMEKCTYCIQRINKERIASEVEGRKIRDGEVKTACQQSCPTEAIVFGDLNDPDSRVAKLKKQPLNYGLLEDLNTLPRTTYLATIRNPNPEIPEKVRDHDSDEDAVFGHASATPASEDKKA